MTIIETIATMDFVVFLLGLLGISIFEYLHKIISNCNSKVFSIICVILTYIVITISFNLT